MNYETMSGKVARTTRALLGERRESIEALANDTGIAHSTLKRRLLLISPFTVDEVGLIAQHFNISPAQLLCPPSEKAVA